MATPYIGNNDFRGYLNYLSKNGDSNALAALNFTGNDGGIDRGMLKNYATDYNGTAQDEVNKMNAMTNYVNSAYKTWLGGGAPNRTTSNSTPKPQLNQAAVDATNQTLGSLGQILADALSNAQTGFNNAENQFNTQEASQRKTYDESTLRNQQNYDANLGAAVRAGSKGLSGLMSALRGGGGAGNDYARNWIQNTVADTTANDIREGYNTFDENRRATDSALSTFLTDLEGRRRENRDTLENNQRAARLYDAQQKQGLYQKLADLYGDAGNTGESARYLGFAGGQAGNIASNMGSKVSAYNSAPIEVKSPDMIAFANPETQSMSASENTRGSGIFSMLDPRRREKELAGV